MSKILVTGGAGFIGSNFANIMADKDLEVVALDNLSLGVESNLSDKVKFVKGDVNKKEDLETAGRDFDYIVHLAASSSAPMFAENMYWAYQNNICGHIRVMQFAKEIGVKKFLFASTSSIYGNNPVPLTEDQEVTPLNHYSVTKMAQEGASRVFAKAEKMEIIAFRFMSVYGINEDHKKTFANLASQFTWDILKGVQPVLYGDGTQKRDFTNVKDVVQGIELAMNTDKKYGFTIFNIGTNKAINLIQLVEIINKVAGTNVKPKFITNPVREGYVRTQLADITKISRELGYKTTIELEDGLKEIINKLRK